LDLLREFFETTHYAHPKDVAEDDVYWWDTKESAEDPDE
jgi:hypothetical protein